MSEVATMLGCSLRSLHRWEESGAIPKAQRMERGEVSARVYTKSVVDQIRKLVRERIAFAAIVQEPSCRSAGAYGHPIGRYVWSTLRIGLESRSGFHWIQNGRRGS